LLFFLGNYIMKFSIFNLLIRIFVSVCKKTCCILPKIRLDFCCAEKKFKKCLIFFDY